MAESIIVVGAGIAGLCVALALGPAGHEITLLERDAPPPPGDADAAFDHWNRRGVGHLRHSHAFLARLCNIIKTDHPELRRELLDEGVRELPFEAMLTPMQKATYRHKPTDDDLTILTSRRTTLELVMRRYVERLPNVRIRSQIVVRALTTRLEPTGALTVSGVRGEDPKGPTELTADIVIDSTGKTGSLIDGLVERGVALGEESEAAGILYFTRHYRLRPGQREPERDADAPATGDLDYLKFGLFPGDSGCFSITLSVPEIEHEMRMAIVHPDVWDHAVAAIPGLRPWTDPDRSAPTSKVFGMGNLQSRWRDFGHERGAGPLNFFAVGDTAIRTNPLYGRGCSFAAAQAYILKAVLAQELAPAERALAYARQLRLELHPYYEAMRKQDRQAVRRAEHQLTPSYKPRLKSRMMKRFLADAVTPAIRHDVELLREAMRSFHMLEHPEAWLKRPANLIKVLAYWARGKRRNAGAYPANPGPTRAEMMSALGLSAQADIDRLAQARAAA